jgi:RND superfamily putative drug exporter
LRETPDVASIIRGVLLPSAMKLLGEWNWYLPRRLEWLPSLSSAERKQPRLRRHGLVHGR